MNSAEKVWNDPSNRKQDNWDEEEYYEYLVERYDEQEEEDIEGIL